MPGTCLELVNGFRCQCQPHYDGPRCQHRLCPPNVDDAHCTTAERVHYLSTLRECPVQSIRYGDGSATCAVIGVAPLFDVQCRCYYEHEDRRSVTCQVFSSPYSSKSKLNRRALAMTHVLYFCRRGMFVQKIDRLVATVCFVVVIRSCLHSSLSDPLAEIQSKRQWNPRNRLHGSNEAV